MPPTPEPFCEIAVRVTPRSARNRLELQPDGPLKVWTTAPPVEGQANAAVCALVAKAAGLAKSRVSVISGHTSRDKRIRLEGLSQDALITRLGGQPTLPEG
ncbi:MAG: DUF167 domain-containing protein [Fimbriimonas ginsengisoli]|uniref:UPF0235 protein HYR64_03915 n=1 Tax=Fimbriimonas ginsengisoli TaxID=1005039 RepID=A0A931LZR9_FIMGI|nr:DUF167 domain-containing protein [Fimbriimonas ginsengisoli]MBI3721569.1 DUF167 domain-containing protein [Fimbriimonas ginsengisoli]